MASEESIGRETEGFGGYTDDANQNDRAVSRGGNVSATRRNVNNPIQFEDAPDASGLQLTELGQNGGNSRHIDQETPINVSQSAMREPENHKGGNSNKFASRNNSVPQN